MATSADELTIRKGFQEIKGDHYQVVNEDMSDPDDPTVYALDEDGCRSELGVFDTLSDTIEYLEERKKELDLIIKELKKLDR